jgi:hypothetical protein
MELEDIVGAVRANRIRITNHANQEALADRLSVDDIRRSVLSGEIIEDYPEDKPYPSCLVCGATADGYPVHSVWGYNEGKGWAVNHRLPPRS